MHEKLEDIGWTSEAAWDETLMITSGSKTGVDNVDDDLARELAFYNQVIIIVGKLDYSGTTIKRVRKELPPPCFCPS